VFARANVVLLVALLLKEVLVGFPIAFVVGLMVLGRSGRGRTDRHVFRGASMAGTLLPAGDGRKPPAGTFLLFWSIVLFLAIGGHRLVVAALAASYQILRLRRFLVWPASRSSRILH